MAPGPTLARPAPGAAEKRARLRRDAFRALAALALALTAALMAASAAASPPGDARSNFCALGLAFYLLALLVSLRSDGLGLTTFRLASWVLAGASVLYGFATLSLAGQDRTGTFAAVDPALVPRASAVLAVGFTAFALGNKLHPKILMRPVVRLLDLGRSGLRTSVASRLAIFAVYCTGLGATVAQLVLLGNYAYIGGSDVQSTTQSEGYTQVLVLLTSLRTYALFAAAARFALSGLLADRACLLGLLCTELVIGLLGGTKESFVIALLAVLIPVVTLSGRRIPWAAIVVASAIFVFFVTPFVTSLRADVREGGSRLDAEESIRVGLESLVSGGSAVDGTDDGPREQLRTVVSRLRLIDNEIVIIDKTPVAIPYRPITEMAVAPVTAVIPRAVWPGKPLRVSGLEFYRAYYRGEGVSSSALTFQGSLYMYGGIGVAVAGMFVLGGALRAVDDARERLGGLRGGLIATIVFVPVVKQELDAVSLLASIPVFLVTYYVVVLALFRRPTKGRPQS
ncbi:hypothetical protein GCM10023340_20210 [Nocardioides marinquilinus]|uniref:O-antigen polysaccharide polymerase Wzy n=1 Tax=Nocardioides marinquilinus TaxID=1210400 RepID=A0ABP9PL89_9ACTN